MSTTSIRRTKGEMEEDKRYLALWYVQGYSQREMCQMISQVRGREYGSGVISGTLKKIREAWIEEYMPPYAEMQAKELARLDKMERELWDAWERSKRDAEAETVEESHESGKDGVYDRNKTVRDRAGRDGDPKFIEQILKVVDKRAKIVGLYQASKVEVDWRKEAEAAIGDGASEMFEEMVEHLMEKMEADELVEKANEAVEEADVDDLTGEEEGE